VLHPRIPAPLRLGSRERRRADEDAVNGFGLLETRTSAISFLGTIIAIHHIKNVTVRPVFQSEVAPRVMTLIDGQQRIGANVVTAGGTEPRKRRKSPRPCCADPAARRGRHCVLSLSR